MNPLLSPSRPAAPRSAAKNGWAGRLALSLPYALGLLVLGLIAMDLGRTGSTVYVDANEMARTVNTGHPQDSTGGILGISPKAADEAAGALDPVCGMTVRSSSAEKAVFGGETFHFCSSYCRTAFLEKPAEFAKAARLPRASHTMRGLPTRMYQWALVLILILSFGVIELLAGDGKGAGPMAARWNLTAWPPLRRLLESTLFPFIPRVFTSVLFLVVIAAGLFGNQNPAMNIAPLLTWTVWWTGLIFAVLYLGKGWCTVCPWDALAGWAARFNSSLDLPWPKALRSIWPAVGLFLALTWVELGMGVTMVPRATAWVALAMLGMAVTSAFLFERKSFCRYACLVGRVSGLYALFSSVEIRAAKEPCSGCGTLDCWKGNALGDGCPTFEVPRTMTLNTYCTMCAECFKTCPSGSMSLNLRPWAADLVVEGKPRADEAALALILLSMTAFHGLTMTPSWVALLEATKAATGLTFMGAFTGLMAAFLALPVLVYAALAGVSAAWARVGFRDVALRFAYALLPIALFYHLAHNAEHFLMEGPKLLALISDPFGWGWNLFGTARWTVAPLVSLEGLWRIQVLFVLVGHLYSLWITARTARRLAAGRGTLAVQIPMLIAMVAFSWASLWLLKQPMEMRLSGM